MKESASYKVFRVANVAFLLVVVFLTLFPFVTIVAQSFSSQVAITAGKVSVFPVGFNITTYKAVAGDPMFWRNYGNTVLYTVVATAISMVLTTMYAYVLSKHHLKGRRLLIGVAVFTMFFNGGLIPNYVLVNSLGLTNTMWAVVLPNAISVFNLLVMKSFFEGMPVELEEAAAIDGLNQFQTFIRVILPLSKAVIATMILFYAVANWNSWFQAFLYLDRSDLFPVTIYLRNLIAGTTGVQDVGASVDNQAQIAANIKAVTMVLTVLPILGVYPFVQKYFVSGVMLGSVKG